MTQSMIFDEACGITVSSAAPSAAHTTNGLQLIGFIYCLIIAVLSF